MKPNPLFRQIFGVILSTFLFTSLFFIGCGVSEEDNNQPSIETISTKLLNVGDEIQVKVPITDADVDDTHIISASSEDTTVATVVVSATTTTTLIITGRKTGLTTVMVSVTDDSGQDNAAAVPVTFDVTVKEPPPSVRVGIGINQPPSSFIDKGDCTVGMTLKPGEGCSYDSSNPFAKIVFYVLQNGTACREEVPDSWDFEGELQIPEQFQPSDLKLCVEWNIGRDNFFNTDFAASKNPGGSWTIKNVP